jgi:hypothetical protein
MLAGPTAPILPVTGAEAAASPPQEYAVDRRYAALQSAEMREARPDDLLIVRRTGITPEYPEYAALLQAGVSANALARGDAIRRDQLQQAGYFWLNRVGGGEKGIIDAVVPNPNDPDHPLDLRDRLLLTRDELTAAYAHQRANPDIYGLRGHTVEEVQKDMLQLLPEATQPPTIFSSLNEFLQYGLPFNPTVPSGDISEQDQRTIDRFWQSKAREYLAAHASEYSLGTKTSWQSVVPEVQAAFAQEHFPDLVAKLRDTGRNSFAYTARTVRGHSVQSYLRRAGKLDTGSPFLDSGPINLGPNLDTSVFMDGGIADQRSNAQRRINMISVYLLGAHPDFPGLAEMGSDSDQQYMAAGEYIDNLFPKTPEQAHEYREQGEAVATSTAKQQLVAEARQVLLQTAREFAAKPHRTHGRLRTLGRAVLHKLGQRSGQ